MGAAASGYLAEALSRKWTKVLSGSIYVTAALWSAFASGATELIAARFVLGLAVGTASFVAPMLIVGVALAIFQQIVGMNTVIYYAPTILRFTGSSVSSAITQTVFIGLTNVVFTLVAVLLLDRFGRRVFLLVGTVGLIVSLVVLGVFFASPSVRHAVPDLALIALIVYIASFAIGLGPVFWLIISEIFPLHLRAPAMSLCTITNWAFNFLVSFTFLSVVGALGRTGTFLLYAALGVLALLFFATRVPETNGRSLEEIERQLQRKRPGKIWGRRDAPAVGAAIASGAQAAIRE